MTRRSVIRVLLSLLLLVSQQMAMSHVIAHWNGQRIASAQQQEASRDDGVSKAFAKDQLCDQCLAFAQIASAVGSNTRSFAPPAPATGAVACAAWRSAPARSVCPFQSRAPPVHV
jgi:hypothetical protein